MVSKVISYVCFLALFGCVTCLKCENKNEAKMENIAGGVEFSGLSRSSLLKLLSALEDDIHVRHYGKKLKSSYTAQFYNIYNDMNIEGSNTEPGLCHPTSWIQLFYGLWVSLVSAGVGFAFGFSAVAIAQLRQPESNVYLTKSEETWIVSVVTLSSPLGCLISGCLLDKIGRKVVMQLCQIPMLIGWVILALSRTGTLMIVARAIMGLGCGMSTVPPRIYMSEITLPNMRGVVGAIPSFAIALGITLEALCGNFYSWVIISWIGVVFSALLFIANLALPESPYYLLLKGNIDGAEKSLKKFRSKSYNIRDEMQQMIEYREENNIRRLSTRELVPALFQASSCKPFAIINFYILFAQLTGVTAITFWAVDILEAAQSIVRPTLGNVYMGVVRMVAGIICSVLLFRCERKTLSYISGTGAGLCFIAMGIFAKTLHEKHIAPMIFVLLYIAFASMGYYPIPLMLMGEMYPLQVRGVLGGLTLSMNFFLIFCANNLYPLLKQYLGFSTVIIIYGVMGLCGVIYVAIFLPETKNMSLLEIEEYFNGFVSTPVSFSEVKKTQGMMFAQHPTTSISTSTSIIERHQNDI